MDTLASAEAATPGLIEFTDLAATDPALSAASRWYKGLTLVGAPHEIGFPYWVGIFDHMIDGESDEWEEWTVGIGRDRKTGEWHITASTNDMVDGRLSAAGAEGLILTIRAAQAAQAAMDAGFFFIETTPSRDNQ